MAAGTSRGCWCVAVPASTGSGTPPRSAPDPTRPADHRRPATHSDATGRGVLASLPRRPTPRRRVPPRPRRGHRRDSRLLRLQPAGDRRQHRHPPRPAHRLAPPTRRPVTTRRTSLTTRRDALHPCRLTLPPNSGAVTISRRMAVGDRSLPVIAARVEMDTRTSAIGRARGVPVPMCVMASKPRRAASQGCARDPSSRIVDPPTGPRGCDERMHGRYDDGSTGLCHMYDASTTSASRSQISTS